MLAVLFLGLGRLNTRVSMRIASIHRDVRVKCRWDSPSLPGPDRKTRDKTRPRQTTHVWQSRVWICEVTWGGCHVCCVV